LGNLGSAALALGHAQLRLLRSPRVVGTLARERGSRFAEVVKEVDAAVAAPKARRTESATPVKHWAAFVLSGAGR
jgi:CHAT domain-containing protein